MPSQSEMLQAIHKANPKTLNMRFTAQQLLAEYGKIKGSPQTRTAKGPNTQSVQDAQNAIGTSAGNIVNTQLQSGAFNDPFSFQADEEARKRIEDQAYARLTRNVDEMQGRDVEQVKQDLMNRGIPYSNDPKSRYQQELGDTLRRYDTIRENARQDATAQGAQDLMNQFNIAQGGYSTKVAGASALSNLGVPGSVSFEQLDQATKNRLMQMAIEKLRLKTASSLSGSGGESDAFSSSGPPGL